MQVFLVFFFNLIMQVKYAACDKSDVFKPSKEFDNHLENANVIHTSIKWTFRNLKDVACLFGILRYTEVKVYHLFCIHTILVGVCFCLVVVFFFSFPCKTFLNINFVFKKNPSDLLKYSRFISTRYREKLWLNFYSCKSYRSCQIFNVP